MHRSRLFFGCIMFLQMWLTSPRKHGALHWKTVLYKEMPPLPAASAEVCFLSRSVPLHTFANTPVTQLIGPGRSANMSFNNLICKAVLCLGWQNNLNNREYIQYMNTVYEHISPHYQNWWRCAKITLVERGRFVHETLWNDKVHLKAYNPITEYTI